MLCRQNKAPPQEAKPDVGAPAQCRTRDNSFPSARSHFNSNFHVPPQAIDLAFHQSLTLHDAIRSSPPPPLYPLSSLPPSLPPVPLSIPYHPHHFSNLLKQRRTKRHHGTNERKEGIQRRPNDIMEQTNGRKAYGAHQSTNQIKSINTSIKSPHQVNLRNIFPIS